MGEESFRDRINKDIKDFPKIYASLLEAYEAKLETRRNQAGVVSDWHHAFDIPFESANKLYIEAHPESRESLLPTNTEAVVETIHKLKLDELQLGPLYIKDHRISTALDIGLLTVDGLMDVLSNTKEYPPEIKPASRAKPDRGDPFFWRALLEIFCRAYNASSGRPPWPLTRKIDLAFDMDEIRRNKLGGKWNSKKGLAILNGKEPYKTKYPTVGSTHKSGVGEDRIREIIKWVERMDDSALSRLQKKFGDAFDKVLSKRLEEQNQPKNADDLKTILEKVDRIFGKIAKTSRDG